MAKPKVLVIVGPTASGKSNLAVRLAKKFNWEIISADSRQVYKGLNIGTGKITKREMRDIPHHLLDVANPRKRFSAAQYKLLADNSLQYIVTNSKLPIVVGGTGLYIDALAGTVSFPNVEPNKKLREQLGKKSAKELFKILKKKDPRRALTIDLHNKVRLIRALEIIDTIGKVPTFKSTPSDNFIYIGLEPDNIDKRIYKRLMKRLPGIIREVDKLHKQGLSWKRLHELGLEYRYVALYLQDKLSREETSQEEMAEKLYIETRRYAKRQMTWFKRNPKIKWFKPTEFKKIIEYARMALLGD